MVLAANGEVAAGLLIQRLPVKGQGNQRVVEEMADLYYHSLVLLASRGLTLADVEAELERRHSALANPPMAQTS